MGPGRRMSPFAPKCRDTASSALRFAFAHPGTDAVIVGTINPDNLRQLAAAVAAAIAARDAKD